MADCFLSEDATKLMLNKYVVFIGSSVIRSMYKDFVKLLQHNVWMSDAELRKKGEKCFQRDELLEGGIKMEVSNGTQYREVRQYRTDHVLVRFYFITRCYNNYVESIFKELEIDHQPDLILMNSGLWDLTRYGANPVPAFQKNLDTAFTRLTKVLPKHCLVIWVTCMPISQSAKGGVFVPEVEHLKNLVRLELLQANAYSADVASSFGFDVLDLCFFFRNQLHRIAEDGIHWDMTAHRRFTNLILSHVSEAWGVPLPGRAVETPKDVAKVKAPPNGKGEERKIISVTRRRLPKNRNADDKIAPDKNDTKCVDTTHCSSPKTPLRFISSGQRPCGSNAKLRSPIPVRVTDRLGFGKASVNNAKVSTPRRSLENDVAEALHRGSNSVLYSTGNNHQEDLRSRLSGRNNGISRYLPTDDDDFQSETDRHKNRFVWVEDYCR